MTAALDLVIFDFDGTLADSFAWLAGELRPAARRWGFRLVSDHETEALRHMSAAAVLRELGVPGWKMPLITRDLRNRMARDIARIRLFDGVPAMLETLAEAGLRLGIVSSNNEDNVACVLGPRLFGRIEALECGAALSGKAIRLRRLLRRLGAGAASAIYIGDEIRDIEAARRAGMRAGAVTWGYTRAEALAAQRPELLFQRTEDISQLLGAAVSDWRPAWHP